MEFARWASFRADGHRISLQRAQEIGRCLQVTVPQPRRVGELVIVDDADYERWIDGIRLHWEHAPRNTAPTHTAAQLFLALYTRWDRIGFRPELIIRSPAEHEGLLRTTLFLPELNYGIRFSFTPLPVTFRLFRYTAVGYNWVPSLAAEGEATGACMTYVDRQLASLQRRVNTRLRRAAGATLDDVEGMELSVREFCQKQHESQ